MRHWYESFRREIIQLSRKKVKSGENILPFLFLTITGSVILFDLPCIAPSYTIKEGGRKMKTFEQWLKANRPSATLPEGNINGSWFRANGLPMIVQCTNCQMTTCALK